jgi:hypothetical protein
LRALCVVPEMARKGVELSALPCALQRIEAALSSDLTLTEPHRSSCPPVPEAPPEDKHRPEVKPLWLAECAALSDSHGVLVLGPTLSGSLEPWKLSLVSASATAESNDLVLKTVPSSMADGKSALYVSLALHDNFKLSKVSRLSEPLDRDGSVVFLSEASTFGYAAAGAICDEANKGLFEHCVTA